MADFYRARQRWNLCGAIFRRNSKTRVAGLSSSSPTVVIARETSQKLPVFEAVTGSSVDQKTYQ